MNFDAIFSRQRALTLVELLIAVALVAIIIVLGLGVIGKLTHSSRNVRCLLNLRQIWTLTQTYIANNNGSFPYAYIKENYRFWPQEISDTAEASEYRSFICPAVKTADINAGLLRGIGGFAFVSYGINFEGISASTATEPRYKPARLADLEEPSKIVAYVDYDEPLQPHDGWYLIYASRLEANWDLIAQRHGGRINAVYCDGHAASVTKKELFPIPAPYFSPPWARYKYIKPL